MGFKKTILLDQKLIVELVDRHTNDSLPWDEFPLSIKAAHAKWMGSASKRTVIPDRPKEEDYFYANPQDCLQDRDFLQASWCLLLSIFYSHYTILLPMQLIHTYFEVKWWLGFSPSHNQGGLGSAQAMINADFKLNKGERECWM
jgi:hypothetical protein